MPVRYVRTNFRIFSTTHRLSHRVLFKIIVGFDLSCLEQLKQETLQKGNQERDQALQRQSWFSPFSSCG